MDGTGSQARVSWSIMLALFAFQAVSCAEEPDGDSSSPPKQYRGVLGSNSKKIKHENDKTYLWAGGELESADSQWYNFTDAAIRADELQFGIGKDRIRAIDDPLFVSPDDPRLLDLGSSPYRRERGPRTNDEIKVIGYVEGDQARAYPVALLDGHELVNDRIAGKPITVGW